MSTEISYLDAFTHVSTMSIDIRFFYVDDAHLHVLNSGLEETDEVVRKDQNYSILGMLLLDSLVAI